MLQGAACLADVRLCASSTRDLVNHTWPLLWSDVVFQVDEGSSKGLHGRGINRYSCPRGWRSVECTLTSARHMWGSQLPWVGPALVTGEDWICRVPSTSGSRDSEVSGDMLSFCVLVCESTDLVWTGKQGSDHCSFVVRWVKSMYWLVWVCFRNTVVNKEPSSCRIILVSRDGVSH